MMKTLENWDCEVVHSLYCSTHAWSTTLCIQGRKGCRRYQTFLLHFILGNLTFPLSGWFQILVHVLCIVDIGLNIFISTSVCKHVPSTWCAPAPAPAPTPIPGGCPFPLSYSLYTDGCHRNQENSYLLRLLMSMLYFFFLVQGTQDGQGAALGDVT